MEYLLYPQKNIPIIHNADLCVLGGSCTGVFAAIRAARLGLSVVIVEKLNCLGGTATAGLVNVWHTLFDTDYNEQIISGLTYEVEKRLEKEKAIVYENNASVGCRFNSARLSCLLDEMVNEEKIKLFLHTNYSDVLYSDGKIDAIIVDNKDGKGAIKAKFFIDASGDGFIARDIGLESYKHAYLQPPTSCYLMYGDTNNCSIDDLIKRHGTEFGLEEDWGWAGSIPNIENVSFRADNHIFNVDCSNADDLTFAEVEGRRKAKEFTDLIKKYYNEQAEILSLCQSIGIRDTIHYKTNYRVTDDDLLLGKQFEDTIAKGTYRIDIHHHNDNGITFKYLDGTVHTQYGRGENNVYSNWRNDLGLDGEPAKYYCVPFKMLVQDKFSNFIPGGRMLNADSGAFGALRVMVNLNQMGEAAGVAAYICVEDNITVQKVDGRKVRQLLNEGGSAL